MGSYSCTVHGKKVSGHTPTIKFDFTVGTGAIQRADGSKNVTIKLTHMRFYAKGGYGYPMTLYVKVTNGSKVKLAKSTETHNKTWSINISDKTLTSPNNTSTTLKLSVGVYSSDKKHCYSSNPTWVKTYIFTAPVYDKIYKITYASDEANTLDLPQPQEFSMLKGGKITDQEPSLPVTIDYHLTEVPADIVNRAFIKDPSNLSNSSWNTKGSTYSTVAALLPNTQYAGSTINHDITVYAKWGNAQFTPPAALEPAVVTFEVGNGVVNPPTMTLYRQVVGYSNTSGSTTISYLPDTTYTTTTDVNMYPVCVPKTLYYKELPVPPTSDPPVPPYVYCDGYVFEGWYFDSQYQNKVEGDIQVNGNMTLYARYYKTSLWICDDDGTDKYWRRLYDPADFERADKVYRCEMVNGQKQWVKDTRLHRCIMKDGVKIWEEM